MAENIIEEEKVILSETALDVINSDLVSFIETLKDLVGQLDPQVKALAKELSPVTNTIKANVDKDETLLLVEQLTANTGTILEVISLLEGLNDLRQQLEPQLKGLAKEASPVFNSIKANLDRDETLLLVERLAANTGTLVEMISLLEGVNDLRQQLEPQLKLLAKEASPALTALRSFIDNDKSREFAKRTFSSLQAIVEDEEVLGVIDRAPNLKKPVIKFMDSMCAKTGECEDGPLLVETTVDSLLKLTEIASTPLMQNLVATIATSLQEASTTSIEPVSPLKTISALRDKDVQRATGLLFYFLKKIGQSLNTAT